MIYLIRAPEYIGRPEKNIADWITSDWAKAGYTFTEIKGSAPKEMRQGVFYDTEDCMKNYIDKYIGLYDMVKEGDSVLFVEGWNVSIPFYKLLFDSMGKKVRLFGIFHSAINVPGEFLTQFPWATPFEQVLGKSLDKIFVATKYIREKINLENVVITGLPFPKDIDYKETSEKKGNIVIFSHRWWKDKRPDVFVRLANYFKDKAEFWLLAPKGIEINEPNIKVVVNKTRAEYLANLRKGKIIFSSAQLETFGYSVCEGLLSGCIPLLVRSACYPELYPDEYLYSNDDEMKEKFLRIINQEVYEPPLPLMKAISRFDDASVRMFKEMQ